MNFLNGENGNNGSQLRRKKSFLETWSGKSTRWIGSTQSLIFHTALFIAFLYYGYKKHDFDRVLLVLTTLVSLEAIYLSIFIQMTVNRHTRSLEEVEEDIGELQENLDEIHDEVEEIAEEVPVGTEITLEENAMQRMEHTLKKLTEDFQALFKSNNRK